jgi:drug/metabolite transporter (DMT)-like permease
MIGGSLLVGIDTFSDDYVGYILVLVSDIIYVVYSKLIESFKDLTGVSSLKLLLYNNILSIPILLIGAMINGEYPKIYIYFVGFGFGEDNTLFGLIFFIILSCVFSAILLSTLFMSIEKSSSLMTSLLNNAKMVFISVFMYFFDSSNNKLNILILLGLIMSTFGAVFINAESLFKNLSFKNKGKREDITSEKKNEKIELIGINNESQEKTE